MLSRWPNTVSWLLLATSAVMAVAVLVIAWQCQWSGPFRDYWEVMPLIEATFTLPIQQWPWHELWEPYGGAHRLVIPKLLFILDFHLTGGSNTLILLASMICLAGTFLLVAWRVRQCYPDDPQMQRLGASIALLTLFSATQLFNLNYSYDTQWFGSVFFSTLALFIASQDRFGETPVIHSAAALSAALLASLNNMAGFLVWPSLLLLLLSRTHGGLRISIAIIGMGVLAVFLPGTTGQAVSPVNPEHPWLSWLGIFVHVIRYDALYLASPISRQWPVAAGTLAWIAMGFVCFTGWQQRRSPASGLLVLLALLALQALLVASATAWGRIFYPLDMAMAERYQAIAMVFMLCAGITLLTHLQQHKAWACVAVLTMMALLIPLQSDSARKHIALGNTVAHAHTAASLGMTGMTVARATISFPAIQNNINYLERHHAFLMAHQLAYLRDTPARLLAGPITGHPACSLVIHHALPSDTDGIYELWATPDCTGATVLALHDQDQQIRGFLLPMQFAPIQGTQWHGYANQDPQRLQAIALSHHP